MRQFTVIGTDADGKSVRAKVEATSEQHARERMGRRNVTVHRVEPSAADDNAIVKAPGIEVAVRQRQPTAVVARTVVEQPPARMPSAVVKWAATGVWKDDGHAATLEIMAATQREAEQLAIARGLLVELVVPASMAKPAAPPPIAPPTPAPAPAVAPAPQIVYLQAPAAAAPIQNVINLTNNVGVTPTTTKPFSRGTAGLLSFLIPGLGQMYKGQLFNGLAWFGVVIVGYVCFIVPGVVLHVCCVLGAMRSPR